MASSGSVSWFDRLRPILSILLFIAIVAGGAVFLLRQPAPAEIVIIPPEPTATPAPTLTPAPTATPGPFQVYVTGAVANPEQIVTLPYGSRVQDAIDAVGGFTEDADRESVNLAQLLRDGDQVHVFAAGQTETLVELPTPNDSGIVYVNTATVDELTALPGIGPALGQRIVDYREANGPFTALEDLDNVSGIGPSTLENIAPFVSFEVR